MTQAIVWYEQSLPFLFGFTPSQVWAFVSPLLAGAVAAFLTRWFRKRDDKQARRQEWLAGKLQETYFLMCAAHEYPGMPQNEALKCKQKLDLAISQIDLFADEATKKLATEIVKGFAEGKDWIEYDALLTALRDRFRAAMHLPKLGSKVVMIKHFLASQETAQSNPEGKE